MQREDTKILNGFVPSHFHDGVPDFLVNLMEESFVQLFFGVRQKFKHAYSPVFRIDNFFEVIPKSIWCYPTFYSNIRRNFPFAWRSSLHKVESRHLDFFFRETDAPLPHGRASRCWLRFFWLLLDWRWCSCESGFETWRLTGCFGRRRSRLATSRHFCRLGCFRRL